MCASMFFESQPFKNGILDTPIESQSLHFNNMSLFERPNGNKKPTSSLLQTAMQNEPIAPASGIAPLSNFSSKKPEQIKIILDCLGTKEIIKDAPLQFKGETVLLVPILEHIKYLRKPIQHQSVSYYSEEDQLNVYVGIEGENISPGYAIPVQELRSGHQFKLTLFIKQTDEVNQKKEPEVAQAPVVDESQQIVLSLPDMVTKS